MNRPVAMTQAARTGASDDAPVLRFLENAATGFLVHDGLLVHYANGALRELLGAVEPGQRLVVPPALATRLTTVSPAGTEALASLPAAGGAQRELRVVTRPVTWNGRDLLCSELVEVGSRRADAAIRLIGDAAAAIRGTSTLPAALRGILRIVGEQAGWSVGEVWLPDEEGSLRRCCGWRNADRARSSDRFPDGCGATLPLTPALRARLLERREIVWYGGSIDGESRIFRADQAAQAGLHSACAVPVSVDERVVAVLLFYSEQRRRHDTLLTQSIAAAMAPLSAHLESLRVRSELEEADQRLQLVLKGANTATWEWDLRNHSVKWDEAFNRLYAFPDDRRGGSFHETIDRIHPDDRQLATEAATAAQRSGTNLHVEYRIILPDGATRWVLARGITIVDAEGVAVRMVGACWDETAARSAADKLELLARFHDENPQPAFRVRCDGTVGERNTAGRKLLASWGIGGAGRVPDALGALVDRARETGRSCVRDVVVDGAVYQANVVAVRGRDYVNVYATDVTALRRGESALQQATRMEAIGQLAGGIAHDFNNRLTVILGGLELLEGEFEEGSDAAAILGDARHAAENSSNLARQLLAISRPQRAEPAACDANAVIRRLETMLDRCLGASRTLDVVLPDPIPEVVMDPSGFEDVLVNLTINARDAMQAGDSLTIETAEVWLDELAVTGTPDLAPGPYVRVAVSDTGKGMPAEVRERAFEPFFTTKAEKGTGLGLSMVYSFVRQAGGHVSIYSEPGRGTCVKLYLPVAATADASRRPSGEGGGARPAIAGTRVLIVEDQPDLRNIAGRIVADLGCDVHTVGDATAALEYLERGEEPDVLFTDIVMPGELDGFALAEAAERKCPGLSVILTSGYTAAGPFADPLKRDNGTRRYVTKPYSRESLARALELAVTGAGAARTAARRRSQAGSGTAGERSES